MSFTYLLIVFILLPSVFSSIISPPYSTATRPLFLSSILSRQADNPIQLSLSPCSESSSCPSNGFCSKFSDKTPRCFPGACVECISDSDCNSGSCIAGICLSQFSSCKDASDCTGESACFKSDALPELPGACVVQRENFCASSDTCPSGTSCFSIFISAYELTGFTLDGKPIRGLGSCIPDSPSLCTEDANCSRGSFCVKRENGKRTCIKAETKCEKDGDCAVDDGQVCFKLGENGEGVCNADPFKGIFPIDGKCRNGGKLEGSSGSGGDGENGVCVDAGLLEEAGVEDFVFDSHRMAKVLCDEMGSCATAGHMVEWNGVGMMMKTYCEIEMNGRCEQKVIKVNSPKWTKGRRVGTKTSGLQFTAVAARWESRMEEIVLKMGIRMGM